MSPETAILVIRGESEEQETVARALADEFRVIEAESGDEALPSLLGAAEVVVLDLDVGRDSGLDVIKMIKARESTIRVVAVTKQGDVETAVSAMKLGVADCLIKPVDSKKLQSTVLQLLQHPHENGQHERTSSSRGATEISIPPGTSLEDLERAAVEQALEQHNGNRTHAAKTLGISVRTLQRKLKAWGLPSGGTESGPQDSPRSPSHGNGGSSGLVMSSHSGETSYSSHAR